MNLGARDTIAKIVDGAKDVIALRELEIGDISRQLKETAKELHIPIIALAQLNRNVTHRLANSMGRLMLSDLKDFGSIEQDADMVLFINRPAKLGVSEMDESYAELIYPLLQGTRRRYFPSYTNFLFHPFPLREGCAAFRA